MVNLVQGLEDEAESACHLPTGTLEGDRHIITMENMSMMIMSMDMRMITMTGGGLEALVDNQLPMTHMTLLERKWITMMMMSGKMNMVTMMRKATFITMTSFTMMMKWITMITLMATMRMSMTITMVMKGWNTTMVRMECYMQ